jgi:hypothetical protein
VSDDMWLVYCLECRATYYTNDVGLVPETGRVICPHCRGDLTNVIDPPNFIPVPLKSLGSA